VSSFCILARREPAGDAGSAHWGNCIATRVHQWGVTGGKMLSSRSWESAIQWKQLQRIREQFRLLRSQLYLPCSERQAIALLRSSF
jgi:hypothetical protein